MSEATLIFPNQLFEAHPGLAEGRSVYLAEDALIFGNDERYPVSLHKQKLVLHRASMQAYTDELREAGYAVNAVAHTNRFQDALPDGLTDLHVADPTDFILEKRLKAFAEKRNVNLHVHETPAFLTPPDFLEKHIASRKKPFMASFYQAQRKRMDILVDKDGKPEGGQWSYDEDNRKKLPKNHEPPAAPKIEWNGHVEKAVTWVEKHFPDNPGEVVGFRYAVTRRDAEKWLREFVVKRFEEFGPYEDAISTKHRYINHSLLTPMLNVGLLTPMQIIDAVISTRRKIPLNSVEGFVRQVIGWREFMHGIYKHRGVEIRTRNYFEHTRKIPESFYSGSTGIAPIDRIIKQLMEDSYCHHIERLMVLGNFMLLCRFDPQEVYRWFMELFIDAYDWVMVPNVYGMSQFADGGTFTTKPYISGSNYVLKMSDEKKGEWTEIWDGLFWTFVADHKELFLKNPRSSMMARTWDRFSKEKQKKLEDDAGAFLDGLG